MWLIAVVAAALLVLPWLTTLALAHHHHLDATAVTILAAVSIPLSALWLAWVTVAKGGGSGAQASSLSLAQVADQLAVAVGKQWAEEATVRRLNDPYPLPVSWSAADPCLTDAWDSLVKLGSSGAGWPAPPAPGTWAADPDDLAGEGGELAEVLAKVPTGRLVVLGEPGAGKTILMVRLVLGLLARRAAGGPVPFLASAASWDPSVQDLHGWLAARLVIDHPALAAPPPAGVTEPTQAAALLASGLILPVLDGLDEIPEQVRGPAISRINDTLRPGERLVVTCRTQQYQDAVRPLDGPEVTLRAATAVQVRLLGADVVRDYLSDDAAGPAARARWAPVFAVLGTEVPAAQALSTPLMVGLARAIYNPRPGELAGTLRDPAELCNPALPDQKAVESLLFDAFIPAAYSHNPGGRWKAPDAEKWLVFLARYLEREIGSPDLAWWQLQRGMPLEAARVLLTLPVALAAGVASGVGAGLWAASSSFVLRAGVLVRAGASVAVGNGVTLGLLIGLCAGFMTGSVRVVFVDRAPQKTPARGMQINVRHAAVGVAVGVAYGLTVGLANSFGPAVVWLTAAATMFGLTTGLEGVPGNLAEATSPRTVLARDRRAALLVMLAVGGAFGIIAGVWLGVWLGVAAGVIAGFWLGVALGLWLGTSRTAWPSYLLTVGWLAFTRRLPWPLMGFLADAHQRGVLRQVGAVYQFRHIDLQHRLANRDANQQQASPGVSPATDRSLPVLTLTAASAKSLTSMQTARHRRQPGSRGPPRSTPGSPRDRIRPPGIESRPAGRSARTARPRQSLPPGLPPRPAGRRARRRARGAPSRQPRARQRSARATSRDASPPR